MTSSLKILFGALSVVSLCLTFWQWLAARRFPLHQRNPERSFCPAITLLKPLKGSDANTKKCLKSWLVQEYRGPVQILFGVASADDPVCQIVRELLLEHPNCDAELLICDQTLGPNGKVSTLTQLEQHIKHECVLISDADVLVPPDFLASVITPLRDSSVGLVNCFYRLANPLTNAMRWEAVAINADFWSQVLQAQTLQPLDFALGAVMGTTRRHLDRIGGFSALLEYLADDYQLGHKITEQGGRILLSPVVAECWAPPMNWREVWQHQLRWARTIRTCRALPYFLSIVSNATLWPLLWFLIHPTVAVLSAALCCVAIRVLTALDNQRRLAPQTFDLRSSWLVPLKDLLNVGIWALAFLGNDIHWRGENYRVLAGGQLIKRPV